MKAAVARAIDEIDAPIQALSARIHANPELGYEEHHASAWVAELLEENGFTIDKPLAGLDTAFRATWRGASAGPRIALLAEYDALPEIGHGCGHNLICTASAAAAIGLKKAYPDFAGTIEVYGTPAEEGGGGKIVMLEGGAFDGVDVGLMFHPSTKNAVNTPAAGMAALKITFTGRPAHAAVGPWLGINAADAAMLFFAGINALRQHIRPDARLHGVILEAGRKPNIVPAHAIVDFMVRADEADDLLALVERVVDVARGAAVMTGADVDVERSRPYLNYRLLPALGEVAAANAIALGLELTPVDWHGPKASEDAGNLSHVFPFVPISVSISNDAIPAHSEQWRDAAISPKGAEALRQAAKILAGTTIDLVSDPSILQRARGEHTAAA